MFKNLKIGTKIGAGFGLLILIACSLGGLAIYNMGNVETESTKLSVEYVPEVNIANKIERTSLAAMYAIRGYNFSGEETYLTEGNEHLNELGKLLDECDDLAAKSKDLTSLASAVIQAKTGYSEYNDITKQIVEKNNLLVGNRKNLEKAAKKYMLNCSSFVAEQNTALKKEIASGANSKKLLQRQEKIKLVNEIIELGNESRIAAFKSQALRSPKVIEDARQNFNVMDEKFSALSNISHEEKEIKEIESTQEAAQSYLGAMNNLLENWLAVQELSKEQDLAAAKVLQSAQNTAKFGIEHTQKVADNAVSLLTSSSTIMIIGLICAFLIGVILAFFIARAISKPINKVVDLTENMNKEFDDMVQVVELIANNDLTQQFNETEIEHIGIDSKDEIGILVNAIEGTLEAKATMTSALNKMTKNLSQTIGQIGNTASEVVSAATEVASSSEQMSRGAKDQTDQVTQISTAVEEMTVTIVESSKNAGEANSAAEQAGQTAGDGAQIVSETIQGMQAIATVVQESGESIGKLAESANQIGAIVEVIDDIADQTNLLALNAAIEAARAGEQGRGFAVVADEVRKLAERTGKATGEITEMIKGIQSETNEAVQSMEKGIKEVDNGRELADKAGNSLNEVVTMSGQVVDMIQQIATASEEQSSAAEQISQNMENIASIARESATGAEQSAAAAEQLNRNAEGMQQIVKQFKIKETTEA